MFTLEEAVGQLIAWPANKCVLLDQMLQSEDMSPKVNVLTFFVNSFRLIMLVFDECFSYSI